VFVWYFQELIPELFYLPEMFTNNHRYKLGVQDDGAEVDNVQLPPWASTPEEFVRFHRMVSDSLGWKSILETIISCLFTIL